jgi:tyrosyl-tRNA synthetase
MSSAFDTLKERGFLAQLTHENEIKELLSNSKLTFYAGFDPTADSLHVGHLLPIMAMSHMQRHGHKPVALVGGGTAMIGDPSGKQDMRKMLTTEDIDNNIAAIKKQLAHFIDFSDNKALLVNNGDWLREVNYVEFLRDIGVHFSVNRMLSAECFKIRLEKGLTFLEFNYMLFQAYDFLLLNQKYGCTLQIGGDDQWSNILAGADLIRKKERKDAFGMTFQLITTADGKKMGKTEKGALWLDPNRTSPYEYYQYWRNVQDADTAKFLNLFTFLPIDEIKRLASLKSAEINEAKKVLAFEATSIVHGKEAAEAAQKAALSLFSGESDGGSIPTVEFKISSNTTVLDIFLAGELIQSKSEGRKLIAQSGLTVNGNIVTTHEMAITEDLADTNGIIALKKGKKSHCHIKLLEK